MNAPCQMCRLYAGASFKGAHVQLVDACCCALRDDDGVAFATRTCGVT